MTDGREIDTNARMTPIGPTTKERLIRAALDLFSARGYHAASVRDICDAARANPGAVSYHFGGKRYLYRATVRQAIEGIAGSIETAARVEQADSEPPTLEADEVIKLLHRELISDEVTVKLLLRDLADGGSAFLEGVAPLLRPLLDQTDAEAEPSADGRYNTRTRRLVLRTAAALLLVHGAWPVVAELFNLDNEDRSRVLHMLGSPLEVR